MTQRSIHGNRQTALNHTMQQLLRAMMKDDPEEEDKALLNFASTFATKYIDKPMNCNTRDDHFFTVQFYGYSDNQFRQQFRTSRYGFAFIANLIVNNDVFRNRSNFAQTHPHWQLAIALQRLGHYGSRASQHIIASDVHIAAGSVDVFTNRVVAALLSITKDWIRWPDNDERGHHGRQMRKEGFPGCVGFIDGTTFPLSTKPGQEGPSYFDRKKRYSVNAQVICDMSGRIIGLHTGCPGSAADSTVFKRMKVYQDPSLYFSSGEFLLADSAYAATQFCVPPFKDPLAKLPDNSAFNSYLAHSRVRNEHCIGVLKARFQSLKELRHRLNNDESMENLCRWVCACCILHNILAHIQDTWQELKRNVDHGGYIEDDGYAVVSDYETLPDRRIGFNFRETLKKTTLETNRAKGGLY